MMKMSEYFDEETQTFKFKTEEGIMAEDVLLYYIKATYPI